MLRDITVKTIRPNYSEKQCRSASKRRANKTRFRVHVATRTERQKLKLEDAPSRRVLHEPTEAVEAHRVRAVPPIVPPRDWSLELDAQLHCREPTAELKPPSTIHMKASESMHLMQVIAPQWQEKQKTTHLASSPVSLLFGEYLRQVLERVCQEGDHRRPDPAQLAGHLQPRAPLQSRPLVQRGGDLRPASVVVAIRIPRSQHLVLAHLRVLYEVRRPLRERLGGVAWMGAQRRDARVGCGWDERHGGCVSRWIRR